MNGKAIIYNLFLKHKKICKECTSKLTSWRYENLPRDYDRFASGIMLGGMDIDEYKKGYCKMIKRLYKFVSDTKFVREYDGKKLTDEEFNNSFKNY